MSLGSAETAKIVDARFEQAMLATRQVAENLQKLRSTVSKNDAAHSRNSLAVQKQIKLALKGDGGPMGAVAEGDEAAGDTVDADVVHALREDLANVKEHCEEEIAQLNLKVQAVEMDATGRSDDVPDLARRLLVSEKGLASVVALTDGMAFRLDDAEAKLGERGDAAADGEAVEKLGARVGELERRVAEGAPVGNADSVGEVLTQAPAHVELDTHIAHFVEAHLAASERHLFAKRGESTRGLGATSSLDDGITLDAALERAADDSLLDPIPASPRREQPLDDDALHDASGGSVADPWGDEPEGDDFAKPGDGSPLNMANVSAALGRVSQHGDRAGGRGLLKGGPGASKTKSPRSKSPRDARPKTGPPGARPKRDRSPAHRRPHQGSGMWVLDRDASPPQPSLDVTDGSTFPNPYPSHHDASTPGASRPATVGGDARRPASQGDFALPELSHRDEAAAAKLDALKGKIEGIALQQPPPRGRPAAAARAGPGARPRRPEPRAPAAAARAPQPDARESWIKEKRKNQHHRSQ
ncbi:hypothetical protein JL722_7627 [Aureococcus anophagefferens]|nr:hypothetical protein JL722_7627 [Aureococcus anophagefferens]